MHHVRKKCRLRSSTTIAKMDPEACVEVENACAYKSDGPEHHNFQPALAHSQARQEMELKTKITGE